ncbi:hypothetical protein EMQ25_13240 [Arsenicitalea aurantiaca]|uniref:Uncharacterized protein n=1 Tax=Arsenicitalea aurantiaca TaxID=1783274 RepID=A0A433X886_9HYPH|nr:hypothetical protein [Arsenicitalea aurantiaca]RUT30272.1 hypothetical protein EMQ25_13240 [Arsenicitalea aurantiaca]
MPSPFIAALFLAALHVLTPLLGFHARAPRSPLVSISGGIAIAYVFLHLLPELAAAEYEHFAETGPLGGERLLFSAALLGLVVFYGLEHAVKISRKESSDDTPSPFAFRLHLTAFALYNGLVGYLLMAGGLVEGQSPWPFALAMSLHFLVNDRRFAVHHKARYARWGRWVLAGSVLVGALAGAMTLLGAQAIALLLAFLGGGIILNVLREELPPERDGSFWFLGLGVLAYGAVTLAIG